MKKFKTIVCLSELPRDKILSIWKELFNSETNAKKHYLIKAIWYQIQCRNSGEKLKQKNITKLNKYSQNPEKHLSVAKSYKYNIAVGTIIKKTYKGNNFEVKVVSTDKFEYNEKLFNSLSAVASEICGFNVSGNDFFGFRKRER